MTTAVVTRIPDFAFRLSRLTTGTSGNLSERAGEGFFVTPSGVTYDEITSDDCPWVALSAHTYEGIPRPSSEWRFHRDVFRARDDVGAIVHAHTTFATALAICGKPVPACHYSVSFFGGPVRVAPYATYGTEELSRHVVNALGTDRTACLLENHGAVAVGDTLEAAFSRLVELEELCRQYHAALTFGDPKILPGEEIERVIQKLQSYGQVQGDSSHES